jgi:tetratricopeptide (TPR) repeat protein
MSQPPFLSSPEAARAAVRLERHVEWYEGFWLAYVFTSSPPQVHILQERVGAKLRGRGREQRVLRPDEPDALEQLLPELLADPDAGCTWIEAVRWTEAVATVDAVAWSHAWGRFVLRANERRELIRKTLEGGLILAAHLDLKNEIRNAGPDLWSIRSFVFELPPGPRDGHEQTGVRGTVVERGSRTRSAFTPDPELLANDLRRLPDALKGRDERSRARIQEKLARHLHASGRHAEAVRAWREVVDLYRSVARQRPDDFLPQLAAALRELGDSLSETRQYGEAEQAYKESIAITERLHQTREHAEVAAALHGLADTLGARGRYGEAEQAYKESIAIRERLHLTRDHAEVAAALHGLADALAGQGRHAEAEQTYEDSIAVGRRRDATKDSIVDVTRIVDELARVLWDPEVAMAVARRAGFPLGNLPRFTSSLAFWAKVVDYAHNGGLAGGVQPIVEAAAQVFPGNAVFARYGSS